MTSFLLGLFLFFGLYSVASAHCPLCTLGAGAAATFASWVGVGHVSIGLFVGAFAVALGSWFDKLWKVDFVYKKEILVLSSFGLTIVPLMPMIESYFSFYLNLIGDYGSFLNRTYIVNEFLVGAILGGIIVLTVPFISNKIKDIRKSLWPYQGVSITFSLLIVFSIIFELWL